MKKKILQLVPYSMDLTGLPMYIMNLYRNIDHEKFVFDFACGAKSDPSIESEIQSYGGKIVYHNQPESEFFRTPFFKNFLISEGYDAIHMHTAPQIDDERLRYIMNIANKINTPIRIVHFHETNSPEKKPQPSPEMFLKVNYLLQYFTPIRGVTNYFACSKRTGESNLEVPFSVIKNAIDTQRFKFNEEKRAIIRKELGVKEDEILIGNIGYYSKNKNQNFLVYAFKKLLASSTQKYKLICIGLLMDQLRETLDKNLFEKIILLDPKPNIQDYFSAMDIFVLPSRAEGLGIVNIEAQASGLPTFISDGCAEEAFLTPLAQQFKLGDGAASLVERLKKVEIQSNEKRELSYIKIQQQGWDMKTAVKEIEDFYTHKKKKNIGIVTFQRACNFGALLQAFALKKTCQKLKHKTEIINHPFSPGETSYDYLVNFWGTKPLYKKIFRVFKHPIKLWKLHQFYKEDRVDRFHKYWEFMKKYLTQSPMKAYTKQINRSEILIVGSDQVWNAQLTQNLDFFLLNIPNFNRHKIAYAASIGDLPEEEDIIAKFKTNLPLFDAISVRENDGKEFLKTISSQSNISKTLDPTLLLTQEEWREAFTIKKNTGPNYILHYTIWENDFLENEAIDYAKQHNLEYVRLANRNASPIDFLRLVANASAIFTDSFHGVIFSILFEKNFCVQLPPQRQSRITELLDLIEIPNRYLSEPGSCEDVLKNPPDYTISIPILEKYRSESISWLKNAIED